MGHLALTDTCTDDIDLPAHLLLPPATSGVIETDMEEETGR